MWLPMGWVGGSGDEFKKETVFENIENKGFRWEKILKGGIAFILFHWVLFLPHV